MEMVMSGYEDKMIEKRSLRMVLAVGTKQRFSIARMDGAGNDSISRGISRRKTEMKEQYLER